MKYLKNCKHCNKQFTTNKEDKHFCDSNHKAQYLRKKNPKPKNKFICENCEKVFESHKKNLRACSRKCIEILGRKKTHEKKRLENEEKYRDVKDIPICEICEWKSASLQQHIVQFHRISVDEYKKRYNVDDSKIYHSSYIKFSSERIKGDKNPAYQHGGKFSPFSEKFVKYEGLSGEEKRSSISGVVQKSHKTQKDNGNYATTVEYYEKQGMTKEEAKKALFNRQTTFSKEICIKKYGEEEGIKRWQARQDKWINTLDSFSDEEKLRILKLKVAPLKMKYSMISKELFDSMGVQNSMYADSELLIQTKHAYFYPDFVHENKIIEFYGDFWHANPNIYTEDSKINYPSKKGRISRTVSNIWNRDEFRINELVDVGYDVKIVWEQDYKNDKDGVVKQCLEFLKE